MAVTKYLDKTGLTHFWGKIKAWCNSLFALDSAVVHKTDNETINGEKTFNDAVLLKKGSTLVDGTSTIQLQGAMGNNDGWQIRSGATANDAGFLEIATYDNGNEPIYFRQRTSSAITRTLTLLDASGNSAFPGSITATTPATSDNSTKVATTAFVKAQGYLTSHQTLPSLSLTTSGSGNAITALSVSNHAITATKGASYITSSGSITGNAATATKLATARSLWGNNFDGSAAISGTITGTPSIEFKPKSATSNNGGYLDFHYNQSTADYTSRIIESASGTLSINNVTITTGKVVTATTFTGALSGNASTATKLATARSINGTNFDGSANITTTNWGTARNISISDSDGTNTGSAVSVNGSGNATLKLPATIKASITGNCSGTSSNVTGTVAIANGGTGATTRLNAIKALTNENVSTNATHFLGLKSDWSKVGYFTLAEAKTLLGLKSAAYTESSAYATSGHTHNELSKLTITTAMNGLLVKHTGIPDLTVTGGTSTQQQVRLAGAINTNGGRVSSLDTWVLPSSGWMQINLSLNESIAYNSDWTNYGTVNGDSDGKGWHSVGLSKDGSTTASVLHFSPTAYQNNKMISLGKDAAIYRWNGVYTSVAVNVSSDKRLKHDISDIPDNLLDAWEDVELKQFIFNDRKRLHTGTIAQQVEEVCSKHNVDISKYGLWCYSSWEADPETNTPAGDEYSIRYEEFLIVEAAYQRRKNKILENRISELENQLSSVLQILQELKGVG